VGLRGPKPLSAEELGQRGSWRAAQRRQEELARAAQRLDLSEEDLEPVEGLGESAQAFWRSYVPDLIASGQLNNLSLPLFVMLCDSYELFWRASEIVEEKGLLVRGSRGQQKINPALIVRNEALRQFRGLCREFGLSPSCFPSGEMAQVRGFG
jgi:P27 family predicted phage terminase small subunit